MNTLEEEVVLPLRRQLAGEPSLFDVPTLERRPRLFWRTFVTSGIGLVFGMVLGGLLLVTRDAVHSTADAISKFNWIVFADGDSLAIDEVGRYLRKLENVADVSFISPDDMLAEARKDPVLDSDIALLNHNPFPAAWRVRWKAEDFNTDRLKAALEDVRVFPGVVDVASDPDALKRTQSARRDEIRLRRLLSLIGLVALIFVVVLAVRMIVSPAARRFDSRVVTLGVTVFLISFIVGAGAVYYLW